MNKYASFVGLSAVLCVTSGCSMLHYTTDLNKVRDIYRESGEKINSVSLKRQQGIIQNDTIFSRKIQCLSKAYNSFAVSIEENKKALALSKLHSIKQLIDNHNVKLQQVLNGGYVDIKKDTSAREISRKEYKLGIYALETEIKILQLSIEQFLKTSKTINENIRNMIRLLHANERKLKFLNEKKIEISKEISMLEKQQKLFYQYIGSNINTMAVSSSSAPFRFSVANIMDKTGKVYGNNSTAISEMVAHALSYNRAITYVDTPFGESVSSSRSNPLHHESPNKSSLEKNLTLLAGHNSMVGIVLPSNNFLSGALVQFDEQIPIKPFGSRISLDIDPVKLKSSTKVITIGLILRANNASDGSTIDTARLKKTNNGQLSFRDIQSEKSSVYLQNTFFVRKAGVNMFEVKSKRLYGGDFSTEVADPINYAVREMVEAGTYELLKKALPDGFKSQANECDQFS